MNLNPKHYKIFVTDDDADDFLFLRDAIAELDNTVILEHVTSCGELIQLLEEGKIPDLIFLDLNMPKISGRDCIEKLREEARYRDVPIIIYSTSKSIKDVDFCYEKGANFYLVKPNTFRGLISSIEKVIAIDWKKGLYFPPKEHFLIAHDL
ncbi:MAG TPA: response regulator [Flavitalea sp.]|nr:response regulator [Flavitalea sp.]